jgi:hypothetical protein
VIKGQKKTPDSNEGDGDGYPAEQKPTLTIAEVNRWDEFYMSVSGHNG